MSARITRTPEMTCPHCGFVVDSAASADNGFQQEPGPGDLTVCAQCSVVLQFGARSLLQFDTRTLDADDLAHVRKIQNVARAISSCYRPELDPYPPGA